ncbi:NADH-ubiquinone oxidoreductase chain J [Thermogutta terrifontis]|jgi:NADH-quinone oxidoreductase subunit J|uniref:NADH-quinone oxidoreductase subunit J n=2 Tax=Thermogutta terrifontis TaxID=1331910 RepID=A0A286RE89_9BACT|nr:NADH-ubiquinone oxidoreductase chain J [Thermogutta terrifontis]
MVMDANAIFFWLLAALAVAGALVVVITPHIVHAAVGLILTLSAVAGLFFLAGAEFLGAMQIMIYVGGTVVLLAFGVMLTARLAFVRMRTTADQWVIAILLAAPLTIILLQSAWAYGHLKTAQLSSETTRAEAEAVSATDLGLALVGVRPQAGGANQLDDRGASNLANMEGYILPFELVSLHLLVVMIGAAYLARRRIE